MCVEERPGGVGSWCADSRAEVKEGSVRGRGRGGSLGGSWVEVVDGAGPSLIVLVAVHLLV